MFCLCLDKDYLLRNEIKQPVAHSDAEPTLRQLAAHIRRVRQEEPRFAKEDKRKRKYDATGCLCCSRCGRKYQYSLNGLCRICRDPTRVTKRNKSRM